MKTEEIALSRVSENEANPREISQANFQKLVQSIIVFPRMLTLRPIVVDETFHALGGNMRLKALQHIVTMDEASIQVKLDAEQRLSDEEQAALMEYWQGWGLNPWEIQQEATTYEPAEDEEQRIIIVYRSEDAQAVADMLGLDAIEKRNFDVDELKEKTE